MSTASSSAPASGIAALLDGDGIPERVATGAGWAEGPVWLPDLGQVWFSDIKGNRILAFDEAGGSLDVAVVAAEYPNGRTLDRAGRIVQCSHGRRQVELLDLDGTATALVTRTDGADGPRFNSPNDVVVDSHGIIWFTDPAYGLQSPGEGHGGEMEYGGCHVFRLDPATGAISTVITDMVRPNGLAFSNDESILYVADSARAQGHGEDHGIRAYDVTTDGRCENGRSFAQIEQGVPDGFRVDHHGNIWTSRAFGISVYTPSGELLGGVDLPETVANLCVGGADRRSLYITATTSLYRLRLREPF
ncbi:MAG TPA: SMP-30/gluconolactonase/LRE family protein [Actinopolymorphaceae bacterium]|jgi:gluconolactonase